MPRDVGHDVGRQRSHLLLPSLFKMRSQAGDLLPVCQELLPLHTSLYMPLGLEP